MRKALHKILFSFIFLMLSGIAFSQGIHGVIIDQYTKTPIPGVTVEIKSQHVATQTSAAGYFEFKALPAGKYELTISYIGYGSQTQIVDEASGKSATLKIIITEKATQLKEVTVKGKVNHESDVSARRKEKNSDNIVNVVSAQTIQRSPDLNVAEVSKRISGVSLQKSSDSKDEFLVVRGLEPRYSNTTINGVAVPSPDDKNKTVALNIFPSELVGSVVVAKTLTPDMPLDAIAGNVNIEFKDAPSQEILDVNLAGGFNQKVTSAPFYSFNPSPSHKQDPATQFGHSYSAKPSDFPFSVLRFSNPTSVPNILGGLTFAKRFLKNRLGFIIAGSDQDSYSEETSVSQDANVINNNTPADGNQVFSLNRLDRKYYYHSNSLGISSKLDYVFNDRNKISLSTVYTRTQDIQALVNKSTPIPDANGKYKSLPTVDSLNRSQNIIRDLLSFALKGTHKITKRFSLDYTVSYANSQGSVPDQAEILLYNQLNAKNGYIINPNSTHRSWQKNFDKLYAGYLNLDYKINLFGNESTIKAGGVISHKHRNNYRNEYILNGNNKQGNSAIQYNDSINENNFLVVTPQGDPTINTSNYTADETLQQFYFMNRFKIGKRIDGIVGVRDEITRQNNFTRSVNAPFAVISNDYFYNDISPQVSLKYNITANQAIRISYDQSISRPNYYELTSYTNTQGAGNQTGNPNLRHARAFNFDGRYEIFSGTDNAFLVGAFYKKIINPIETSYSSGSPVITSFLANVPQAIDYGAEINLIHYFGNFGISANYTFVDSKVQQRKQLDVRVFDAAGNYLGRDSNYAPIITRPLQGQSRDLANVSLIYRNDKHKVNVNFSVLYQGRRVDASQPELNLDYYQQDYWNFSAAADKTFGKRFSIFAKASNISNTPVIIRTQQGYFISSTRSGQDYLFGIRYKFLTPSN